jgi:hypothetical protein
VLPPAPPPAPFTVIVPPVIGAVRVKEPVVVGVVNVVVVADNSGEKKNAFSVLGLAIVIVRGF